MLALELIIQAVQVFIGLQMREQRCVYMMHYAEQIIIIEYHHLEILMSLYHIKQLYRNGQ